MEGDQKGRVLNDLEGDGYVESLHVATDNPDEFSGETKFIIKLSNCQGTFAVRLDDQQMWLNIYTESAVYSAIGPEGCVILDVAYNIGGSEAIAETYFGIMENQKQDNASHDTVDMRSLISYTMPDVSNCEKALDKISEIYLQGNMANKVSRHRANVFYDKRGRTLNKYFVSKSVDNLRKNKIGVGYIR